MSTDTAAHFLHSKVGIGKVIHRRFRPRRHEFSYRLYMVWLDLDEIAALDTLPFWSSSSSALVRFRRTDYLDPEVPDLKTAVAERVRKAGVGKALGRVVLLTNLRNWGLAFNPVSFYFCYGQDGSLVAIVSEITNTPWNERYAYVHRIDAAAGEPACTGAAGVHRFCFSKQFHVSPFMPMGLRYDWRFHLAADRITVHMRLEDGCTAGNQGLASAVVPASAAGMASAVRSPICFDATLALKLCDLTRQRARIVPLMFPFMTTKVVFGIYWQALRLWLKRIPFHAHPDKIENARCDER